MLTPEQKQMRDQEVASGAAVCLEIPWGRKGTAHCYFDAADLSLLSAFSWYAESGRSGNGNTYARAGVPGKWPQKVFMHRLILQPPNPLVGDHLNDDGLDNRRSNLRVCTQSENVARRTDHKGRYGRGVGFSKSHKSRPWYASLCGNYLGRFPTREEAAAAYDRAASIRFGEFAVLNSGE